MTKQELKRAVKNCAAGLVAALDLEQLLGEEVYSQIIGNTELEAYAELQRDLVAVRLRK